MLIKGRGLLLFMVDKDCEYVSVILWEHGGGSDNYCIASCRPLDRCGDEVPSTPLCDSNDSSECRWSLEQNKLESTVDG